MEQSKACTKCGQIKLLSEFAINKHHRDGRQSACKQCYALKYQWDKSPRPCAYCQELYLPTKRYQKWCSGRCKQRPALEAKKLPNTKLCLRCGKSLEGMFVRAIYCSRSCGSMDHAVKHRSTNTVRTARRRLIIERDDWTCYLCSKKLTYSEIHIDHLVPYSRGGSSDSSNLSVACAFCNISRGNRIGIEQLHRLRELRESNDY